MKTLLVILDTQAVGPSRQALARLGITGITMIPVSEECDDPVVRIDAGSKQLVPGDSQEPESGRKRSRGDRMPECDTGSVVNVTPAEFRQKTMLVLVVGDEDAGLVVRTLVNTNEEIVHEPGKIYVCPLVSALGIQPDPVEPTLTV
jgi:nitrogen regulatory protein PII